MYDVDVDGELEFISIRSDINQGAGIAIYKLQNEQLTEYAYVSNIGIANRWLNIATISDLDNDGSVEIAWVETPHIGGTLKVAHITQGKLQPIKLNSAERKNFYSNHAIGERNLCLSVLTHYKNATTDKKKRLYIPSQSRDAIIGFEFIDNRLKKVDEISQPVNFAKPLSQQYAFHDAILASNCLS